MQNISDLVSGGEYVIIAAFVASVTQNIKATKVPNGAMPFVSAALGVIGGLIAAYLTHGDNYASAAVYGLITGLTTSGAYDGVSAIAGAVTAKKAATTDEVSPQKSLGQTEPETSTSTAPATAAPTTAPTAGGGKE